MQNQSFAVKAGRIGFCLMTAVILLIFIWLAVQTGPVSAAPAAVSSTIAYTSFEEPATGGQYTDLITSTINHELVNNPGESTVVYTMTVNELGFTSFYSNTRGDVGLTDGDFVGVTNFTGVVGAFPDGSQGFQISDPDGMMIVTLEEVDLSTAAFPAVQLQHFVQETGWESNDLIHIWVEVDGGATLDLVNTAGSDIDNLGIEGAWITAELDLTSYTTATLKFALDANSGNEALYIDDIRFVDAGLEVEKTAAPTSAPTGETVTYTVVAGNAAPVDDANVILSDTLPTGTAFAGWVEQPAGASESGGVISWSGPISAGQQITLTFVVTNNGMLGDTITNTVSISGTSGVATDSATFDVSAGLGACGDAATLISAVQGSGSVSPLNGTTGVVVEGVVVAEFTALDGFYMQEELADHDADSATSEGVFVYDPDSSTTVAVGDKIRIQGEIDEFNGLTQLKNDVAFANCGVASPVITPTIVTLPVSTTTAWEEVEGMLIAVEQELTVTDSFRLGRFGQVRLSIGGRLPEPTNVVMPGVDANTLQDLVDRSFITIDDALPSQNPDPVTYPDPGLTYTNTLRGGDTAPNGVVGVIDHYDDDSSDDYRLLPTETVSFTHTNPRPADPPVVSGTLQVASFNVLNYFTTFGERGADNLTEFNRQRDKIINAIVEMDADIVGLMEIENHPTDDALQDLVDGLNSATAANTYEYIDSGLIGTDEIKVALIYQTGTVSPTGDFAILDSTVISTFNDDKNRPVLIQTFTELATDEQVTIAVNHLKSKGSSCDDVGDPDQNDGQGNCSGVRTDAAEALVAYLATDPTSSGSENFLIIGDLNSYAMEDPIRAITDAGYTNLIAAFEGPDAYGYTFDGNWGYLDHALSSSALTPRVIGAASWHINADEPVILDYNTNFKSVNQIEIFYSDEPYRASDHDPVLIGLDLTAPRAVLYMPVIFR